MSRYISYQTLNSRMDKHIGILWVVIKIVIAVLLYAVWLIHVKGELPIAGMLYLWLLGFAIGLYLIINVRHLESIMLSRIYTKTDMIEGFISYHHNFSLRISAIQIFTLFILFCVYAILAPGYFTLGLACAPLFLIIRNLLLSSS